MGCITATWCAYFQRSTMGLHRQLRGAHTFRSRGESIKHETTYMGHYMLWLLSVAGDNDACTYDRVLVESYYVLLYKEVDMSLQKKGVA